jgi:tetratricopeptide (TPR) repeat protein
MRFRGVLLLTLSAALLASGQEMKQAEELYQRTDYEGSLKVLRGMPKPDAAAYCLMGQNYLMTGDYKKATDVLQKAVDAQPHSSEYYLWLGRAWGRRAETSSPLTAPMSASKARQFFERSVELDPNNLEAMSDLFDYYLEAPGFLGGGMDKAAQLAERMARVNPAEYHFAQAQIAERRKEFNTAEEQLRRAVQLAPRQVGRVIELARYLAKQGKDRESEAMFAEADKIAPNSPRVMFWRAATYVQEKRNLGEAQNLLRRYMQSELTPDDPPRSEAEKLLKKAFGA